MAAPTEIFAIWHGGMSFHGGLIGVAVATAYYVRKKNLDFWRLSDVVVPAAPFGLLLGRLGNFINGELWGKPTRVPWAVIFPKSQEPGTPLHLILPRHPSQLYEAALEGALLLIYMQWRFWRSDTVAKHPGRLAGEFLLGYALVRIFCEFFREPDNDVTLILGLSRGTFYSLFMIVAGLVLVLWPSKPLAGKK
jgi:phosphatidylglycerol:prolipoprotein diacylglycerol transferase